MADWVNIEDSQIDPDAPLTSELAYSWRDNPIAIAEGAVGAPKVIGQALGAMIALKQSSPLIITDLERAASLVVWGEMNPNIPGSGDAVTVGIDVRTSTDGGATWSAPAVLHRYSTNSILRYSASALVSVGGAVNAVQLSIEGPTTTAHISAACLSGVQP